MSDTVNQIEKQQQQQIPIAGTITAPREECSAYNLLSRHVARLPFKY